MPVSCKLIDGKYRIVGPDGKIEKTPDGNARDGDGHDTAEDCQQQADAINSHDFDGDERDLVRFAVSDPGGNVNRKKGIIYGVAIIQLGEAKGHGVYIDETMLEQVLAAGQEKETLGLKSRFDHPTACSRAIGTFVGRFHNFRRDEDVVRGDLHIADVAAKSPEGDLRDYILDLADEDPDAFGTSIHFRPGDPELMDEKNKGEEGHPAEDDPYWFPHVRLTALWHCDIVDQGAATNGIFGRPEYWAEQAERWATEHPNVVGRIIASYYERKQKQEDEKMTDAEKKALEAELATALKSIEEKTKALDGATEQIVVMGTEIETAKTEALAEGKTSVFALVKDRVAKYEDLAFVMETIELSDDEVKDKYIEKLKDNDGTLSVEAGAGNEGDATFEDKVAEKVKGGKKRGEAVRLCASEFPELHKAYIERTNKERNDK